MFVHPKVGFSLVAALLVVTGCFRSNQEQAGGAAGSQLSEIKISSPSEADLRKEFGEKCEQVKLSPAAASGVDQCPAVFQMLGNYRLKISINRCDSGVTGSSIEDSGKLNSARLQESVKKGCDYDLLLEVGSLDTAGKLEVLYSNRPTAKALVTKASLESGSASVKVVLVPEALAIQRGFPGNSDITIEPINDADLSIDIQFGRAASPAPGRPSNAPSAGPSARPSGGPSNLPVLPITPMPNPITPVPNPITPMPNPNGGPSSPVPQPGPSGQAAAAGPLNGSFVSDCRPIPFALNQFDQVELTVSASEVKGKRVVTSDPRCKDAAKQILSAEASAKLIARERKDLGDQAFEVDLQMLSQRITLHVDPAVAAWNKQKACGITQWTKAKEVDVIALKSAEEACVKDMLTVLRVFDIMRKDSSGNLQVGRKLRDAGEGMNYILGLTSADRPKEWGRSLAPK
jgi:hypothetical protein